MSQMILASASPRRKELLEQIGAEFVICPAKGEEVITETDPSAVVMELSRQKAEEVAYGVLIYNEQHADLATPQDILVIGAGARYSDRDSSTWVISQVVSQAFGKSLVMAFFK